MTLVPREKFPEPPGNERLEGVKVSVAVFIIQLFGRKFDKSAPRKCQVFVNIPSAVCSWPNPARALVTPGIDPRDADTRVEAGRHCHFRRIGARVEPAAGTRPIGRSFRATQCRRNMPFYWFRPSTRDRPDSPAQ